MKPRSSWAGAIVEKIPLFLMAAVASVATAWSQTAAGVAVPVAVLPVSRRLATAGIAYAVYMRDMLWPSGLSIYYPPLEGPLSGRLALGLLALGAVTGAVIAARRRLPALPVGWLWYLGTLVPVIGIVQVGAQSMADRYAYVPMIGLFLMIAWGLAAIIGCFERSRPFVIVCVLAAAGSLALASRRELGYWHDNVSLFQHGLASTRNNFRLHGNLGAALAEQGRTREAAGEYARALAIYPANAMILENMGIVSEREGDLAGAERYYRRALALVSGQAHVAARLQNRLGALFARQARLDEALRSFREAVRLEPDYALAQQNLKLVLDRLSHP